MQQPSLTYVQHPVVVRGHANGCWLVPHEPVNPELADAAYVPAPVRSLAHLPIHTDVLVFRTPVADTAPGGC